MTIKKMWHILGIMVVLAMVHDGLRHPGYRGTHGQREPAAEEPMAEEPAAEEPAAEEPMAEMTPLESAYAGEYAGTVVTMTGPFTDEDAVKFDNSYCSLSRKQPASMSNMRATKEFEATIGIRVEGR